MTARIKVRTLESQLQQLAGFEHRSLLLEQYETPPHIAALALHTAQVEYDSLEGRCVLDAGCGPGVLGAGAALLGAGLVTCADVDPAALAVLRDNTEHLADTHPSEAAVIEPVLCDLTGPTVHRWENYFDTVLMNPPFGTKHNSGADMRFLQVALSVSSHDVYSFHKTSTRGHISRRSREWGVKGEVIAELRYDLPATYRFHKQSSRDIAVDLWRFRHVHTD